MFPSYRGLIAAPHTPFHTDFSLNLDAIERQAAHLQQQGVVGAFVCGTTGEGVSMTMDERRQVAQRWIDVVRGSELKVIVHVGGTLLAETTELAQHATRAGADGVAALAPFYHRPPTIDALVEFCRLTAQAADPLPFFFYHIPSMTHVHHDMREFLERAIAVIPNLAGLKYTHNDLMTLQECLALAPERLQILHGFDEILLAGLTFGIKAATGSTYNFAAPLYRRLIASFDAHQLEVAASLQRDSVRLIRLLTRHDFPAACKAMMQIAGIDCGPVRPPLVARTHDQVAALRRELESTGLIELVETTGTGPVS